jgi:signal transduction histidine kinase
MVAERTVELNQAKAWAEERSQAAEAANRAKSIFLARMSHELRTPLTTILGYTQLMQHDPVTAATQQANLSAIDRSSEHLLALIDDVLEMSRIEAGRPRSRGKLTAQPAGQPGRDVSPAGNLGPGLAVQP